MRAGCCDGTVAEQVQAAVRELHRRGALDPGRPGPLRLPAEPDGAARDDRDAATRVIAVLVEPGRPEVARELLGAARSLGAETGAEVHALCPGDDEVGSMGDCGADLAVRLAGSRVAEDVADAVVAYVRESDPWALLAPSTAFGREVAGRAAAATGCGPGR